MSLAKILKNCPEGMKLYSPIYGEVEFKEISVITGSIGCKIDGGSTIYFHSNGTYYTGGECMLFPSKEQRYWDDFMIPFKNGDVIIRTEVNPGCKYYNIAIFRNYNIGPTNKMTIHCQVNGDNQFKTTMAVRHNGWRLANAEEIERFFTRMHESGYDFKDGKLITLPKFKIGDVITNGTITFRIDAITNKDYIEFQAGNPYTIDIAKQDAWKIKKFDARSLKPYDRVLAKFCDDSWWIPTLVSYVNSSKEVFTIDCEGSPVAVIPFEGHENLIGTSNDPEPYYITWK